MSLGSHPISRTHNTSRPTMAFRSHPSALPRRVLAFFLLLAVSLGSRLPITQASAAEDHEGHGANNKGLQIADWRLDVFPTTVRGKEGSVENFTLTLSCAGDDEIAAAAGSLTLDGGEVEDDDGDLYDYYDERSRREAAPPSSECWPSNLAGVKVYFEVTSRFFQFWPQDPKSGSGTLGRVPNEIEGIGNEVTNAEEDEVDAGKSFVVFDLIDGPVGADGKRNISVKFSSEMLGKWTPFQSRMGTTMHPHLPHKKCAEKNIPEKKPERKTFLSDFGRKGRKKSGLRPSFRPPPSHTAFFAKVKHHLSNSHNHPQG